MVFWARIIPAKNKTEIHASVESRKAQSIVDLSCMRFNLNFLSPQQIAISLS